MNQTCINEAKNLKLSDPELSTDRDVLMYWAYRPTSPSRSPAWGWCSSTFLTTFLFNPEGRRPWSWTPKCPAMLILLIMSRYNQKKTIKNI